MTAKQIEVFNFWDDLLEECLADGNFETATQCRDIRDREVRKYAK